ncbi:unnamed protein product [Symbiodinium sp. CCMP2592]|nr:unnamed protein product [Symbiodinium sp. CCMP2592]
MMEKALYDVWADVATVAPPAASSESPRSSILKLCGAWGALAAAQGFQAPGEVGAEGIKHPEPMPVNSSRDRVPAGRTMSCRLFFCVSLLKALSLSLTSSFGQNFEELTQAVAAAEKCGIRMEEIEKEAAVHSKQYEEDAVEVRRAINSKDEDAMVSALRAAEAKGFEDSFLMGELREQLAELQAARAAAARRSDAESQLERALGEDAKSLEKAIAEAAVSGLSLAQLAPARKRKAELEEQRRREQGREVLARRLKAATRTGNPKILAQVIAAAERAGVSKEEVRAAQEMADRWAAEARGKAPVEEAPKEPLPGPEPKVRRVNEEPDAASILALATIGKDVAALESALSIARSQASEVDEADLHIAHRRLEALRKAQAAPPRGAGVEDACPIVFQVQSDLEGSFHIEKFKTEIDKLQSKQKALSEKIQEHSGGKDEFYAKKVFPIVGQGQGAENEQEAELRAQLDELSGKIDGLQARKEEINRAVGSKRDEEPTWQRFFLQFVDIGRVVKSGLSSHRKSIGFSSEGDIDNRIASIEFQPALTTSPNSWSLPKEEEKKLLAEIQQLKKNRTKVSHMQQMEQSPGDPKSNVRNLSTVDPTMSMKEQKDAINEEMNRYRDEKRKIQEQMTELSEARKQQLGPIEEIQNQRGAVSDELKAKIEDPWLPVLLHAEKYAAEKAERQKEYDLRRKQREAEKLDDQPYVAEITLIEQTMKFCQGLVQSKVEDKSDEKKEVSHENVDGCEILLRKEDREEEFYFAPLKGKKDKNKKKGAGETKAAKITHNAETFRLFDQLKLDAPLSTDQVPGLLEKLTEQLADYQAKVKEWEEKREDMKKAILEGLSEIEEKKAARDAEDNAEEKEEERKEEKEEEG